MMLVLLDLNSFSNVGRIGNPRGTGTPALWGRQSCLPPAFMPAHLPLSYD